MTNSILLTIILVWLLADLYLSGGLIVALSEKAYNRNCTVFGAILVGLIWPLWVVVIFFRVIGRIWRALRYRY